MMIEDGHGTGEKAKVEDGYLNTKSICKHFEQFVNESNQEVYSIIIEKTPTGAGDCFLYIKNNSDEDMYISSLTASSATDETIRLYIKDTGTPAGTTANVPVNRNAGSAKVADVTCYDGVDITGLSGGLLVEQFIIDGNTGSHKYRYNSSLIIPKNQTFTLYAVTGAIALVVSLSIAFD